MQKNSHRTQKTKVGYVSLIGRPNVGKSTLLNKFLGQKVSIISDKPQTTRISILGIKTTQKGQIIFIDNPGIHKPLHRLNKRMMSFVYSSLETADVICLLIDATLKFGHGDEFVIETLRKISTPVFLLINKVDIIKKEKALLLIDKYKDLFPFAEIIPISALKGTNVDVLEESLYQHLPEAERIFSKDQHSTQTQKFLLSEIIREKLLKYVARELPFVTAVLINKIEERKTKGKPLTYIHGEIFVERDSHRKIILGKQGSLIKKIGTEARKEIENIVKTKVFLDLHVRVRKRWRDSSNVLELIEQQ
ncbi:MAG: GTPase Era [Acidobacteriota bacterium]